MSNNNSFGGKLRKVLASMCSLFVGASGVSQAIPLGTSIPTDPKLGEDVRLFGFGDFGWYYEANRGNAKKKNSWLVLKNDEGKYDMKYQRIGEVNEFGFFAGCYCDDNDALCYFNIWGNNGNDVVASVAIPKGVVFDAMRYFELNYFPNNSDDQNNGTKLSCTKGKLNADDEVFLRFILWAFCGSNDAIKSSVNVSVEDLKESIFKCLVNVENPNTAGLAFEVMEKEGQKFAVLKSGYILENFNKRIDDNIYKDFKGGVINVHKLLERITRLNNRLEKEEKKKHIGKYLLGALIGLVGGGALVEGAHHFLGAKRSGSSGKSKDKISSNGKNGQKTKKNLKK